MDYSNIQYDGIGDTDGISVFLVQFSADNGHNSAASLVDIIDNKQRSYVDGQAFAFTNFSYGVLPKTIPGTSPDPKSFQVVVRAPGLTAGSKAKLLVKQSPTQLDEDPNTRSYDILLPSIVEKNKITEATSNFMTIVADTMDDNMSNTRINTLLNIENSDWIEMIKKMYARFKLHDKNAGYNSSPPLYRNMDEVETVLKPFAAELNEDTNHQTIRAEFGEYLEFVFGSTRKKDILPVGKGDPSKINPVIDPKKPPPSIHLYDDLLKVKVRPFFCNTRPTFSVDYVGTFSGYSKAIVHPFAAIVTDTPGTFGSPWANHKNKIAVYRNTGGVTSNESSYWFFDPSIVHNMIWEKSATGSQIAYKFVPASGQWQPMGPDEQVAVISAAEVNSDLEVAKKMLKQAGIDLDWFDPQPLPGSFTVSDNPLNSPATTYSPSVTVPIESTKIYDELDNNTVINLVYVNQLVVTTDGDHGPKIEWAKGFSNNAEHTALISAQIKTPYTLAHELVHLLVGNGVHDSYKSATGTVNSGSGSLFIGGSVVDLAMTPFGGWPKRIPLAESQTEMGDVVKTNRDLGQYLEPAP